MCCDHPFSQRSRITEKTVGVGVGGDREVGWGGGGWGKIGKRGVGNIGGSSCNNSANYVKRL